MWWFPDAVNAGTSHKTLVLYEMWNMLSDSNEILLKFLKMFFKLTKLKTLQRNGQKSESSVPFLFFTDIDFCGRGQEPQQIQS